jgi:hypothetical protein
MKTTCILAAAALTAGLFAPNAVADGRKPGSVLIYTVHRSGPTFFTIISVTNTNTYKASPNSLGGTTDVHYEYANANSVPGMPFMPDGCNIVDRVETLTPADTLSVLTACHNATSPNGQEGYLVVSALDPVKSHPWSHNYLVGSEFVVSASGVVYSMEAIPFTSPVSKQSPIGTDLDGDGILDFDGIEYEAAPAYLIIDAFVAIAGSQLALLNLTGSDRDKNKIKFTAYNDNEFLLSDTREFACWFDQPLVTVSAIFQEAFLKGTPHDPQELDISCTGVGRLETGWAMIDSISVKTPGGTLIDPDGVILGSITAGQFTNFDGGRLLWESEEVQKNGGAFNP